MADHDAAVEVPDEGYVRLRRSQDGLVVSHVGTGEEKLLEGEWWLEWEEGFGKLVQLEAVDGLPTGESEWVGNIFSSALCRRDADAPVENCQLFIKNLSTKTVQERAVAMCNTTRAVVIAIPLPRGDLKLEVYISEVPKGNGWVRWALPRVLDHLRGNHHHGSWLTKAIPNMEIFFAQLGYCGHLRRSATSIISCRRYQGLPTYEDDNVLREYDVEATCTTEGLILLCVYAGINGKFGQGLPISARNSAESLVSGLVNVFVADRPHDVPVLDAARYHHGKLSISNGMVTLNAPLGGKIMAGAPGRNSTSIAKYLLELGVRIRRKSQYSAAMVNLCQQRFFLLGGLACNNYRSPEGWRDLE